MYEEKRETKKKGVWKKPVFEKEEEMKFTKEIMEKFNGGRFCVQCSACHGCR